MFGCLLEESDEFDGVDASDLLMACFTDDLCAKDDMCGNIFAVSVWKYSRLRLPRGVFFLLKISIILTSIFRYKVWFSVVFYISPSSLVFMGEDIPVRYTCPV